MWHCTRTSGAVVRGLCILSRQQRRRGRFAVFLALAAGFRNFVSALCSSSAFAVTGRSVFVGCGIGRVVPGSGKDDVVPLVILRLMIRVIAVTSAAAAAANAGMGTARRNGAGSSRIPGTGSIDVGVGTGTATSSTGTCNSCWGWCAHVPHGLPEIKRSNAVESVIVIHTVHAAVIGTTTATTATGRDGSSSSVHCGGTTSSSTTTTTNSMSSSMGFVATLLGQGKPSSTTTSWHQNVPHVGNCNTVSLMLLHIIISSSAMLPSTGLPLVAPVLVLLLATGGTGAKLNPNRIDSAEILRLPKILLLWFAGIFITVVAAEVPSNNPLTSVSLLLEVL